jgi:hypothetical protein
MALVSLDLAILAEGLSAYGTPVETLGSVTRFSASTRFDAVVPAVARLHNPAPLGYPERIPNH